MRGFVIAAEFIRKFSSTLREHDADVTLREVVISGLDSSSKESQVGLLEIFEIFERFSRYCSRKRGVALGDAYSGHMLVGNQNVW